jgi:adenylate cyclase
MRLIDQAMTAAVSGRLGPYVACSVFCHTLSRGEEVDHAGDGFFVAFGAAGDALDCAVEIQRTLAEHRRGHGFAPGVRIGLHTSAARRGGAGYRGRGVNAAARIAAHAGGGEIVASSETMAGVETGLAVGEGQGVKLKGIAAPVEVAAVRWG